MTQRTTKVMTIITVNDLIDRLQSLVSDHPEAADLVVNAGQDTDVIVVDDEWDQRLWIENGKLKYLPVSNVVEY